MSGYEEHYQHRPVEPARVHITGSDIPLSPAPAQRKRYGLSARSFTLNANDPVQQILPLNNKRCEAWIMPLTNPITVYSQLADAKSGGNAGATLPAAGNVPFPMNTTDPVWATAAVLPTTVSVWAIIEE